MDTSVMSSYSEATKTLTAKWSITNFDQLEEHDYHSDTFTSDFNPTIHWNFSVQPKNKTNDRIIFLLTKVNHGDVVNGKADCDINATIGTANIGERRSIVSLESNNDTSVFCDCTADSETIGQLMKERNEVEIIAVITYMVALDKLETTYDDRNNRLDVKWTIDDYPLIRRPLLYESKSFASIKFPNAKWFLAIHGAKALVLYTDKEDNHVKVIVTAKLGPDTISTSLVAHDFYTESIVQGVRCPVHDLVSRIENNVLVFEVTIEYQVVEDADAKIGYKLFRQNAALLESGTLSDFSLLVGNEKIPVHKCILVTRWPYFKTAIESGLDETTSNTMPINTFDVDTVRAILDYVYTNSTTITTVTSALTLMEAAHCYDLTELFGLCEQFVCIYINSKDVLKVLIKCQILSAKQGVQTCIEFLKKEAKSLNEYDDFDEFEKLDRYGFVQSFVDFLVNKK